MNLIQRIAAPTPKFFRVVRTIGICLAAAGGALIASPIALPIALVGIGNYLIVAGTVASAISQTAVESDERVTRLSKWESLRKNKIN